MDGHSGLLLFAAGLAGGVVTSIVVGASLITFPALLAAGLLPIVANASNTVALTPGNFAGGFADVARLPRWDRSLLVMALVGIAGSIAGAVLLLVTPEKAFTAVVPLLIGFATLVFALAGRIRAWIAACNAAGTRVSSDGVRAVLFALVAIYGGYFGAGMSVMLLALFSLSHADDFRTVNVLKNFLSGLTSGGAVVVLLTVVYAWRYWLR